MWTTIVLRSRQSDLPGNYSPRFERFLLAWCRLCIAHFISFIFIILTGIEGATLGVIFVGLIAHFSFFVSRFLVRLSLGGLP